MAQALTRIEDDRQLPLNERWEKTPPGQREKLCAGCRQHAARYGFRADDAEPEENRRLTLCFSCFRMELNRRQAVAAQLARGWNAEQVRLPLEDTLRTLTRRRRRAQIAARHALGV